MAVPTLDIGSGLETALASGHPWIYRNHLPRHDLGGGEWVRVVAGRVSAFGLYDAEGAIGVRLYRRDAVPDRGFLQQRVEDAVELRSGLTASSAAADGTNAYRLLFGEGDFLPGITADRYGRFVVMRSYAASVERFVREHSPLAPEVMLADAEFWNQGQSQFLQEGLEDDSDWAEAIDELNALLRH